MEFRVFKGPDCLLHPALPKDVDVIAKLKIGEIIALRYRKPRDGVNHRRFFAMLRVVMQHTEHYPSEEHLLTELKVRVGHYEEFITYEGELVYVPKSIDFEHMDELEFRLFFDKCVDAVITHILAGVDQRTLENCITEIIRFA